MRKKRFIFLTVDRAHQRERKKEASKDESRAHAAREEEFAEHSSVDGNAGGCISDGSGIDAWIHATHHRRGYQV